MSLKPLARPGLLMLFAAALSACGGGSSDAVTAAAPGPSSAPAPAPAPAPTPTPSPAPAPGPAPAAGPATEYALPVTDTDPAIDPSFGDHYAYINTSVAAKGKLFVFFPATGAPPHNYTLIETAAANAGFHSIGLAYPNGPDPVNILCSASTDADCTTKIREETYAGTDATALVAINAANSVLNRLTKALLYLHAQHPSDGWNHFLGSGNSIRWDLVRVSGLSQGGGLAGYIAKAKQSVDRACFFSSPADWDSLGNQPAGWVAVAGTATSPTRVYGFNNTQDPIVPLQRIKKTWQDFGLDPLGAVVNIDATQAYAGTHEMTTSLGTQTSAHTSTASDLNTPLTASGVPLYLPIWNYTCFN